MFTIIGEGATFFSVNCVDVGHLIYWCIEIETIIKFNKFISKSVKRDDM